MGHRALAQATQPGLELLVVGGWGLEQFVEQPAGQRLLPGRRQFGNQCLPRGEQVGEVAAEFEGGLPARIGEIVHVRSVGSGAEKDKMRFLTSP